MNTAIEAELLRLEGEVEQVETVVQGNAQALIEVRYAITSAYPANNLDSAKRDQDRLDENLALEHIKGLTKKSYKRMIKKLRQKINKNSRPSDPKLGNDKFE